MRMMEQEIASSMIKSPKDVVVSQNKLPNIEEVSEINKSFKANHDKSYD